MIKKIKKVIKMMIRSLLSVIEKNFKILGRSKFSLGAIILVPFLVILLAGFAFNSSSLAGINVGVYSDSYSNLTEEVLLGLGENFTINKLNSSDECIDSVKSSNSQICVIFPKDLSEEGTSEEVVLYVDHSRLNLAYTLLHEIGSKISIKASDLGISLVQELISALGNIKTSLPDQKSKIELSKNNLQTISEKAEFELSTEHIENISSILISVQAAANSTTVKRKINETLVILSILNESLLNASGNLEYIETQSEETLVILNNIAKDSDEINLEINQINVLEAEKIISPIKTKIESINVDSNNKDYLLPTIISLIALFGAILLSSTFVLQERKSKAYFRKFLTPTRDITFLLGNYLTCLAILIAQFLLVFLGLIFVLNMNFAGVWPEIVLILFLALSAFTFIGMFIGYLFKSEETTIFAGVLVAALMMFFSNAMLPVETISNQLKNIALFNPLVVCDAALKKVTMFGLDLSYLSNELYVLAGFFLVFAILSFLGRKITKRML